MLHDPGAQPFQGRHELLADAHPQKAGIPVGRVDAVGDAVAGNVRIHVAPAGVQHWADPVAVLDGHDREAARARSPDDTHEHGLGAVVRVMAGGDSIGAGPRTGRTEGLPSNRSGARLQVAAGGDRHAGARERNVERSSEALGDVQLGRRLRTQPVVHPVGEEPERIALAKPRQDVEERHRIRPTADGHEHRGAAGCEPVHP